LYGSVCRDREGRSFTIALAWLQGRLGQALRVDVALLSGFFGVRFNSRLERVESLPPDARAVVLHFEDGQQVDLDPLELHTVEHRERADTNRLELHIDGGVVMELSGRGSPRASTPP